MTRMTKLFAAAAVMALAGEAWAAPVPQRLPDFDLPNLRQIESAPAPSPRIVPAIQTIDKAAGDVYTAVASAQVKSDLQADGVRWVAENAAMKKCLLAIGPNNHDGLMCLSDSTLSCDQGNCTSPATAVVVQASGASQTYSKLVMVEASTQLDGAGADALEQNGGFWVAMQAGRDVCKAGRNQHCRGFAAQGPGRCQTQGSSWSCPFTGITIGWGN